MFAPTCITGTYLQHNYLELVLVGLYQIQSRKQGVSVETFSNTKHQHLMRLKAQIIVLITPKIVNLRNLFDDQICARAFKHFLCLTCVTPT